MIKLAPIACETRSTRSLPPVIRFIRLMDKEDCAVVVISWQRQVRGVAARFLLVKASALCG